LRTALPIAVLLVIFVLSYGYWHVQSHGWLYISLYDISKKDHGGRILNSEVVLFDSAGNVLTHGKSDDRYGVVYLSHREVGLCVEEERQAPFSKEARQAWRDCFEKQSRWLVKWVRGVKFVALKFDRCQLEKIPVSVSESMGDWCLWWIP
jgi:hypothetical protein